MKSELAEELLDRLMGWDRAAFQEKVRHLEALASYKFDEYGNFRPGVKFFESLAAWLDQFADQAERATALEFVLERLIFISDAEMTHLIELVYDDHMDIVLRERVASQLGLTRFDVARVTGDPAFATLRRRSLVLGASDGARLDRLRRSAPFLSHEQFLQSSEPPSELVVPMCAKLAEALQQQGSDAPASFAHVFLVDDFAGSGETLLREKDGECKGKLVKLHRALEPLGEQGLVCEDIQVTVILYVAAQQAFDHVVGVLKSSGLPHWEVRVVQTLPSWVRVDEQDHAVAELAERYYDDILTDEHKGRAALGYANCALPVVLSHNTPNNSVSLLWADTTDEPGGLQRRALFPRYERHHRDRP
ncbi:MAG: hypothetical protein WKF96_08475 [Solirubrobacteraceae bacterium]